MYKLTTHQLIVAAVVCVCPSMHHKDDIQIDKLLLT